MSRIYFSSRYVSVLCILALLFMTGCADDLRNRSVFDPGAGNAVIRFSVEDASLTRDGEAVDMESVVDHAYLLFYQSDASLMTAVPVAAVKAEIDPSSSGSLKFKMPLALKPDTDYKLLAIANADGYVPSGFKNFGAYLDSWCQESASSERNPMHLYCPSRISPDGNDNLPMSGGVDGKSVFRFSIDKGAYKVAASLSFRRMVARIDVANMVKEGFIVEGVMLCNWRDAVSPVDCFDRQGNRLGAVRGVLSGEDEEGLADSFLPMTQPEASGTQQLKKSIYCFPSVSYDSHEGDDESTALIIKARYGEDKESSYYRINVGVKGNISEVTANTKYLVAIQSVKGSGASTPGEAYASNESSIILSVVEDWDLDGNNFDMDDKGNFIILSKSSLNFDGETNDNVEVKVLTSKGLVWSAEYKADNDNEASASAFNVTKLSDSAISIGPRGRNESEAPLTGVCCVTASTGDGTLMVNLPLSQEIAEEKPYEPVIPEDMPFALIPESYDRVKIDHVERTIEIDGFDPDCFNSFIDIPFKVYINDKKTDASSVNISTTLEWPLEGRISKDKSSIFVYCQESFNPKSSQKILVNGQIVLCSQLGNNSVSVASKDNYGFNIAVGAMGPDDPAIIREITLTAGKESVKYLLIIRPRSTIIDDVILSDKSGNLWLIMDRNIQDFSKTEYKNYIGRDFHGEKYQAYNFTHMFVKFGSSYQSITIPFKFEDENNASFKEDKHMLYRGITYPFDDSKNLSSENENTVSRLSWLKKYCYSENDNMDRTSPFYEYKEIENWIFPSESIIDLCRSKLRVSKMRMFLVSEVPVKNKKLEVPVCCYIPLFCYTLGETSETYGYFASNSGKVPESLILLYYDATEGKSYKIQNPKNHLGFSRLVRKISTDELEDYKNNYLGYGGQPHKLTKCHPDTYDSEGWIPN